MSTPEVVDVVDSPTPIPGPGPGPIVGADFESLEGDDADMMVVPIDWVATLATFIMVIRDVLEPIKAEHPKLYETVSVAAEEVRASLAEHAVDLVDVDHTALLIGEMIDAALSGDVAGALDGLDTAASIVMSGAAATAAPLASAEKGTDRA